jgi:hypothetical protein
VLGQTLAHFWPDLPEWVNQLNDTRFQPMCIYSKRFLVLMGLLVFLGKCGSRRQIGRELDRPGTLANLNRLAGADQQTIAHLILQLIECGNLLTRPARVLFGSLVNLAHRLLESLGYRLIPPEAVSIESAARLRIHLNSS